MTSKDRLKTDDNKRQESDSAETTEGASPAETSQTLHVTQSLGAWDEAAEDTDKNGKKGVPNVFMRNGRTRRASTIF